MTKTTKDVLVEARGLIEKGWTQGAFARNKYGNAVDTTDDAACFCSLGALRAACSLGEIHLNFSKSEYFDAKDALHQTLYYGSIIDYNDAPGRTKDEVLEVFDKTIARLNAEENTNAAY